MGSSPPLLPGPSGGVAAAMKLNLAKVLSQSYRKLKVVFGYKTKQFIDILVKLLVCCANLPQGYGKGLAAPERAGGSKGIPRHSEAFRGAIQGRISAHAAVPTRSDKQNASETMSRRWAAGLAAGPDPSKGPSPIPRQGQGGPRRPDQKFASGSRKPKNCKQSPGS